MSKWRPDWRPISGAPKDRYVVVWPPTWAGVLSCAKWDDDRFSRCPDPFWGRVDARTTIDSRREAPTHYAEIPSGPAEAGE